MAMRTRELERRCDARSLRPADKPDQRAREEGNREKTPAVDHVIEVRSFLHQQLALASIGAGLYSDGVAYALQGLNEAPDLPPLDHIKDRLLEIIERICP